MLDQWRNKNVSSGRGWPNEALVHFRRVDIYYRFQGMLLKHLNVFWHTCNRGNINSIVVDDYITQ